MTEETTPQLQIPDEKFRLIAEAIDMAKQDLDDKIYERLDDYSDDDRADMMEKQTELEDLYEWLQISTGRAFEFQDSWEIIRDSSGDPVEIEYPGQGVTVAPDVLHHVWTVLDVDGRLYVSPGYHWVNRQMHIMTIQPWTEADEQKEWIY